MAEMKGKEKYPHLFEPLRICNLRLKNRMFAAPSSPSMITTDGHMTTEMIAYLEEKAKGGVAVVTYGEAIVHSATGRSHDKQLQLDSHGVKLGLTEAAKCIHAHGAYANIQLSHGGKYGGLASRGGGWGKEGTAYGPVAEMTPAGPVEEMPKEMIYEIIEAYGKAAKLAKDCRFDMVQVHAAHGWLFSQFLSPGLNTRKDEFGGSLENRMRFLRLSIEEIKKTCGKMFPVEVRFSGDDMSEMGMGPEECIEAAKMLDDIVDLFNISCGNHEDHELFCRTHPSAFFPRGVNVYLAAEMKKHLKTPVATVGSLIDPAQMEEIIATGQADIIEIGRGMLADPQIANKALYDCADDITPCLRCYECFGEGVRNETIKCAVNPIIGQELQQRYMVKPAREQKKVLIAGGGPGGMQAAITAARRGHKVMLAEKSDHLGGNLVPAGAAFFKEDIRRFCNVLIHRVERAGVKVLLNTEVTPGLIDAIKPDALVVAIGANELRPPIKGLDGPNVVMACDAELDHSKLGKRVAIMGGGLVGAEGAVAFAKDGHEVSIIEMKDAVAEEINEFFRGGLMPHVEKAATLYTSTTVKEVVPEGVKVERDGEEFLIEADTVVCALGFRPKWAEVDALCACVDENYVIGDCASVGQIYDAVSGGYYTALRI
ncbi:MAG: FAD-dependent oxidoreductase [Lachnospiraceae bacterium]|nr:FAD-dependent oxidoreductase [Lachnospiraceae bacterium]